MRVTSKLVPFGSAAPERSTSGSRDTSSVIRCVFASLDGDGSWIGRCSRRPVV